MKVLDKENYFFQIKSKKIMGTWNASRKNLDYSYPIVWDEYNEFEDSTYEKEYFYGELEKYNIDKDKHISTKPFMVFGEQVIFRFELSEEAGYYHSLFLNANVVVNINDFEEYDLENLEWIVKNNYDHQMDGYTEFGTETPTSQVRALKIVNAIKKRYDRAMKEFNYIIHKQTNLGVCDGWAGGIVQFKDAYKRPLKLKYF